MKYALIKNSLNHTSFLKHYIITLGIKESKASRTKKKCLFFKESETSNSFSSKRKLL